VCVLCSSSSLDVRLTDSHTASRWPRRDDSATPSRRSQRTQGKSQAGPRTRARSPEDSSSSEGDNSKDERSSLPDVGDGDRSPTPAAEDETSSRFDLDPVGKYMQITIRTGSDSHAEVAEPLYELVGMTRNIINRAHGSKHDWVSPSSKFAFHI
jgi:hypothetical protein